MSSIMDYDPLYQGLQKIRDVKSERILMLNLPESDRVQWEVLLSDLLAILKEHRTKCSAQNGEPQ